MAAADLSYFLGRDFLYQRQVITVDDIARVDLLLLYFSASWCPASRAFGDILVHAFKEANKTRKELEVILITKERTEIDHRRVIESVPWLSLPYDLDRIQEVFRRYQVTELPSVLLIRRDDGSIIRRDCRETLESDRNPLVTVEKWRKELTTLSYRR